MHHLDISKTTTLSCRKISISCSVQNAIVCVYVPSLKVTENFDVCMLLPLCHLNITVITATQEYDNRGEQQPLYSDLLYLKYFPKEVSVFLSTTKDEYAYSQVRS
jgi:hypothetical protein